MKAALLVNGSRPNGQIFLIIFRQKQEIKKKIIFRRINKTLISNHNISFFRPDDYRRKFLAADAGFF
jgi:hypothetical protein